MRLFTAFRLPSEIIDLYAQVKASGQITLSECFLLKTALINNSLSEDELLLIERIFYSVRRGRIKVVDELKPRRRGELSLETLQQLDTDKLVLRN